MLEQSSDRRAVDADWACGGSFYAHVSYERQLRLKSEVIEDAFARIAKMPLAAPVPVMPSQEQGYRMRAPVAREGRSVRLFPRGHARALRRGPDASAAARNDRRAARRCRRCWAGRARRRASSPKTPTPPSGRCSSNWSLPKPSRFTSTRSRGFPDCCSPIINRGIRAVAYGSPYVTEHIAASTGPVALTHHVQSFFQGNRYLLPELVSRVLAQVPEGTVTDLYAGVGLFAVPLAAHGQRQIVAVEGDRSSARDLESNADAVRLGRSRAASVG